MAIAYVEHPVSQEDKQGYRKKGFSVVDARYAPSILADGDKLFPKKKARKREQEAEVESPVVEYSPPN